MQGACILISDLPWRSIQPHHLILRTIYVDVSKVPYCFDAKKKQKQVQPSCAPGKRFLSDAMPFEGFKGGGYDRSTMIRTPYSLTKLPIVSNSEPTPFLRETHPSLQANCGPARRIESMLTSSYGRRFDSISGSPTYEQWPRSLMFSTRLGDAARAKQKATDTGPAQSSQIIGSFWLVDGQKRPNTCPPSSRPMQVPWMPKYNMQVRDYSKGF